MGKVVKSENVLRLNKVDRQILYNYSAVESKKDSGQMGERKKVLVPKR